MLGAARTKWQQTTSNAQSNTHIQTHDHNHAQAHGEMFWPFILI